MRLLDAEATRAVLPMAEAIDAMRKAFSDDREVPVRSQLGVSLFMPGRVGEYTGMKVVSTAPGNPVGIVIVFGPDGSPMGAVDGPTLTAIRTGAASGLATELMARPDATMLAMLGAGAMARDQIEAVRAVRPIERVMVWSRTPERAERLAAEVGGAAVSDPDRAVEAADVVCCATPATEPLFSDAVVRQGTHINAVGAFRPSMVEVPGETLRRAFVVVDDVAAAEEEAGDLIQARRFPVDATMADLLSGRVSSQGHDLTVFKSVGVASQDVAAAVRVLELAGRP